MDRQGYDEAVKPVAGPRDEFRPEQCRTPRLDNLSVELDLYGDPAIGLGVLTRQPLTWSWHAVSSM